METSRQNALESLYTIYGIVATFNKVNGTGVETSVSGNDLWFSTESARNDYSFSREKLEDLLQEDSRSFLDFIMTELYHLTGKKKNSLPSGFQIGEKCTLNFLSAGEIKDCKVMRVHFTESKVMYDVQVYMEDSQGKIGYSTRLYNVDSVFLSKVNG